MKTIFYDCLKDSSPYWRRQIANWGAEYSFIFVFFLFLLVWKHEYMNIWLCKTES